MNKNGCEHVCLAIYKYRAWYYPAKWSKRWLSMRNDVLVCVRADYMRFIRMRANLRLDLCVCVCGVFNQWMVYVRWMKTFFCTAICNGALRCIVANNAYNSLCPNVSMRIILKRCTNEMQEQRFSIVEPSTCRFLERMREREFFFL